MADIAFTLFEVAVKNLYTVYKNHKDSKRELEEVGNFLLDLSANSSILNSKSARLKHVRNTLRKKLKIASKQVEDLSKGNPDFFHSDERLRKIQGVRQKVKEAMEEAKTQMQVDIFEHMEELLPLIPSKPAKKVPYKHPTPAKPPGKPNVQHPSPAKPDIKHPKPPPSKLDGQGIAITSPRSKSSPGRAILPSKEPPSPVPKAPIANKPKRDKMVELFVPMDSEKQARDVVEKLKALPGVKDVIFDQMLKKVLVVPLKGVTLNNDQLLQHAQLKNKFVAPTLWSKRPR